MYKTKNTAIGPADHSQFIEQLPKQNKQSQLKEEMVTDEQIIDFKKIQKLDHISGAHRCNSNFKGSGTFFWPLLHQAYTQCTYITYIHAAKVRK